MGREENLNKLDEELRKDMKDECQIFCVMSRIRKALEHHNLKEKFPVINFYCNWALHTEIDKTSSIYDLLLKIEQSILSKNYDIGPIMSIANFENFRKEIKIFLNNFKIVDPFSDTKYWINYRKFFVRILIDSPLNLTPKDFKEIRKFSFIKTNNENDVDFQIDFENHYSIKSSWTFLNH